jgi:hypothetical protein
VLRIGPHTAIGLTPPMGDVPGGIDLDVRDGEGQPVLSMEANDWNLDVIPDDLVCSPYRDNLHVEHARSSVAVTMKFHSLDRDALDVFLQNSCPLIARGDLLESLQHATWPIAVATLSALIPWPRPVRLNEYQTLFENRWVAEGNIIDHACGIQM